MLKEKLKKRDKFMITTELGGTVGTNIPKSLEDADSYVDIDGLNIIDCASARLRINSFSLAHIIQTNMPDLSVVPHLTCRDRSILGIQADLLGAHALGVRYVLATTGDHPKEGPYKDSAPVYNLTSIELIKLITRLNDGLDYNGDEIKGHTNFTISAVAAPGAANLDKMIDRMKKKVEAGTHFFQTQPMYDIKKTKAFANKAKSLDTPILLGLMPLKSLRMANYMNDNVAGIDVPEEVMDRLESGVKGVDIAKEFVKEARALEGIAGIHIMALGDIAATNEIIRYVKSL
jgi:homocysteine S-methyltransferase